MYIGINTKISVIHLIIYSIIISFFIQSITNPFCPSIVLAADSDSDYVYSLELNASKIARTTDGKNPVDYDITITNTGNNIDTFTVFTEVLEITGCSEPEKNEWSVQLDRMIVILQPSQSEQLTLTISTSCSCQVGCKATIAVNGLSSGDPAVNESLLTYTTRGPAKKVSGIVVEINYNPTLSILYINSLTSLDVYIYNIQNHQESIVIWPTIGPETWSIGISPDEFTMLPNSKRLLTLNFIIPINISFGSYPIQLTAQAINDPNNQGKDRVNVLVKPDVVVNDITFSKTPLRTDEKVKLNVEIKNIGLAPAMDIPIIIYDELDVRPEHELYSGIIPTLEPNKSTNVILDWQPKKRNYNITIWLNSNSTVNELRQDNNLWIEPVVVEKVRQEEHFEGQLYWVILFVILIIVILVLIYFKLSKSERGLEEEPEHKRKSKTDLTHLPKKHETNKTKLEQPKYSRKK